MRKVLLFLFFWGTCSTSVAQIFPYQDIKLENQADYRATEKMALSAANFLLTTRFAEIDEGRGGALVFLNRWMTGTKDYQFYLQGYILEISADKNLLSLYIAAMVKYTLENKKEAVNPIKTEQEASAIVLAYCNDPKNNFKLRKKLRKLLEDHQPVKN